jgi:hypothetical protein
MTRAFRLLFALLLAWAAPALSQDPVRAHRVACDGGELASCTLLGLIYESGASGERDLDRALDLYGRACARGVEPACARLRLASRSVIHPPPADPFVRVGRIADAETGAPVPEAVVDVPALGIRALSDEAGRVDLGRLPSGRYRIVVRRLGYESVEGTLPVPWSTEFLTLMPPSAAAEDAAFGRIFGRVTDLATGEPLADVEVVLVRGTEARTLSNASGRFGFAGLEPGAVEVRLTRLGYETRTTTVTIERGRTVEIHAALSSHPIELEPVEVFVGSPYLERSGLYLRARRSAGSVFTRRDIERARPLAVSELAARAPGVSVLRGRRGTEFVTLRESDRAYPGPCRLLPYLDGVRMTEWDVDAVRPEDLEAIEIYQGADVPAEYANLYDVYGTPMCGVVLIWTRR